jgi:hypothetical protein
MQKLMQRFSLPRWRQSRFSSSIAAWPETGSHGVARRDLAGLGMDRDIVLISHRDSAEFRRYHRGPPGKIRLNVQTPDPDWHP